MVGDVLPDVTDRGVANRPRKVLRRLVVIPMAMLAVATGALLGESPTLPSSRYGDVLVGGSPAPIGTRVSATAAGRIFAEGAVFDAGGESRYRLDVPGDRNETPQVEGPQPGQAFEIRVGGVVAATSVWSEGSYEAASLAATAGPDLAIQIDDGVTEAVPEELLDFAILISNLGPGDADGVIVGVAIPAGARFVAATDGGAVAGGVVTWPPAGLADGEVLVRTLTLRVDAALPAAVESLSVVASVSHNGAAGADPDPTNDSSTDTDALDAAPDLQVEFSNERTTLAPGATAIYRAVVSNLGTQDATGVRVDVELAEELDYFASSHGGQLDGSSVSFPSVALAVGESIHRAVTVRIPTDLDPSVSDLSVTASVSDDGSNGEDSNPADNFGADVDSVSHLPDLALVRIDRSAIAVDPQTLTVSGGLGIDYSNRGTVAAAPHAVVVFEDLDSNSRFSRATDRVLGEGLSGLMEARNDRSLQVSLAGVLEFRNDRLFVALDADEALIELDESNNIRDTGVDCASGAAVPAFEPVFELSWPGQQPPPFEPLSIDSVSTPIVLHLTDDNGDGLWNELDVPAIVFVSANLAPTYPPDPAIVLRAIRGDNGAPIWNVPGVFAVPLSFFSLSGLAGGDIDHDGKPEVVTSVVSPDGYGFLQAYEHDGVFKWRSASYDTHPFASGTSNRDSPLLADLDGDGEVEIAVGAHVFDRAGHLLWRGTGGQAYQTQRNNQLVGGAIAVVGDIDLDGLQELICGSTVYRWNGEVAWETELPDGYPALIDTDDDPEAEIVVVSRGFVRLHDTDGALLWGPLEIPGSDPESGGAPAVGDLDGDGSPEIVVAGSDVLWAIHADGTELWQVSTRDYSSSQTSAVLFDLDGDGELDVVYRDERRLRLLRGRDGEVLFETALSSTTMTEMPIVADVDRDGNAEIVVSSDHAWDYPVPAGERTAGIRVLGDAGDGWTTARPIWNQHAFDLDNVDDAGAIPAHPAWGWLTHNSFRAASDPLREPLASPDVSAGRILVDSSALPQLSVTVRIGNGGATVVAPGLEVALYDGPLPSTEHLVATGQLAAALFPGAFVDLTMAFDVGEGITGTITAWADSRSRERECDEANNLHTTAVDLSALGLWLTKSDGRSSVAPGDVITYTLAVHNSFAETATGIALRDDLPTGLLFVSASDGGVESGGTVTWPPFALESQGVATRTVEVQVDPALPLAVTSITNAAAVSDDGAQGADPTPENNQAIDTDQVTSVIANAGGPYAGDEGADLPFDGSGSFDRDGGALLYAWDLDDDGDFDDGDEVVVHRSFEDDGMYVVRLRVTDDEGEIGTDESVVVIGNVPPVVTAPADLFGVEGGPMSLEEFLVSDPGTADAWTAVVTWGDGESEPVALEAGIPVASHTYLEDGSFEVELCVTDDDGGTGCASSAAAIANEAPVVRTIDDIDLGGWQREELGGGQSSRWTVSAGRQSASEDLNGEPSFFVGELSSYGTTEWTVRVSDNGDDDYFGIAVGFETGDLVNPAAEYLLIDWKREDQTGSRRGLALSRVHGVPAPGELWVHQDQASNGSANRVDELQRAMTLGSTGWSRHTDYRWRLEVSPERLRLYVDGRLEIEYLGLVPGGRTALYDYSQARVSFVAELVDSYITSREGDLAGLRVPFSDPGVLDTHEATVDWGDGAAGPADLSEESGRGEVVAEHRFADDGAFEVVVCVTDDEESTGCASTPAVIENVAPLPTLVAPANGFLEDPVDLTGSGFADPGVLDSHVVSVDWGDGTSDSPAPEGGGGVWSVNASHLYGTAGEFEIHLCVADDDGGAGCDVATVTVVPRALDLALVKSVLPGEARPGQNVVFNLRVENVGSLPASGVTLSDRLPPYLNFVGASLGGIESAGIVTWSLGTIQPGAVVSPTLTLQVAATAPYGETVTNDGLVADDGSSGPDIEPANNRSIAALRFSDALTPIVAIDAPWNGSEGSLLSLTGVHWNDTTAGQGHSGTIDWGDGESAAATLVPANGTSGLVNGSHRYAEDGSYAVVVCVTDATGRTGCAEAIAAIENVAPDVVEPGSVSLHTWIEEEYAGTPSADWQVAADGLSVLQRINSRPSIFYSPLPAIGSALEGTIRVEPAGNWDDDYIGFVLGFDAGDTTNPDAEYLLVDWKQANQDVARRGLAVSWVRGAAVINEFWAHRDDAGNGEGNGLFEIARGLTLGDTGWADNREYRFRFETTEHNLRIWVDDVLQFDLVIPVPEGRFGFYNYSQEMVRYRGFSSGLQQRFEGEQFELRAPYVDAGILDTHEATVDWDDGTREADNPGTTGGFGVVEQSHSYADDGDYLVEVCVEDDEGASNCGPFPIVVLNVAPTIVAGPSAIGYPGVAGLFELGTFSDPGVLDSHTATVDWGDFSAGSGEVEEDDGQGEVRATHTYDLPGLYPVAVCVEDDDGGMDCDSLAIEVLTSLPPALRAEKRAAVIDRDGDGMTSPGDEIVYTIEIFNDGDSVALEVTLTDAIPANTQLVPGSILPESGLVSSDPVVVAFDPIEPGATSIVQFAVAIDEPLAAGVAEIVNSGVVSSLDQPGILTDDPDLPGPADPTRTPVHATPQLVVTKVAELVDLDGNEVASAGDQLEWEIDVFVQGDSPATGLLVQDAIGEHLQLIDESVVHPGGRLLSSAPLAIAFDEVPVGGEVSISFRTTIDPALPGDVEEVANQASVFATAVDPVPSDDPATPEALDPTIVPVYVDPQLTLTGSSVPEGNVGSTPLIFQLSLDHAARIRGEVAWVVEGLTATIGEDFGVAVGTAIFEVGESEVQVVVDVIGDVVVENDETLRLVLSAPVHLHLIDIQALGTIVNDDVTTLSVSDTVVSEGDLAEVEVSLSTPSDLTVSVEWNTQNGSALAGSDFVAGSGVLVFAPRVTSMTVAVATLDDEEEEEEEAFSIELSNPTIATIADGSSAITILDDDQATCILLCPESIEVGTDPGLCTAFVEIPPIEGSEGCGTVTCSRGSGEFELGISEILCSAEAGSPTCSFQVAVVDVEPPVVEPPAISVPNAAGRCEAEVPFDATASDNCPGAVEVSCLPASGSAFPVGTRDVICQGSDLAGNAATGTGWVEVLDFEPPQIESCPEPIELEVRPGGAPTPIVFDLPFATDNCPGVVVACVPESGALFPAGETSVVCTAADTVPLEASCGFTITVIEPSVLEIPALSPVARMALVMLTAAMALVALRRRS